MLMKEPFSLEKSLKKIKDAELDIELLRRENEKLCKENTDKVAKLTVTIFNEEIILESELKKSGEDKLECKLGSVSFKKMPDEWKYQDEILMAWIISLPEKLKRLYLKVKASINKDGLKRQILLDNEALFEKNKLIEQYAKVDLFLLEGEVFDIDNAVSHKVEGIEIKHQNPKFSYTIKNLKK